MTDRSDYRAVTLGYLIMRIGLGPVLRIVAEPRDNADAQT
jgi:hypothetical protein